MSSLNMPEGRERSKYNSLKGGLSLDHILPCTESCLYKSICPVYDSLAEGFKHKTFTSTCAIEAAQYLRLKEFYTSSVLFEGLNDSEIGKLIMLELRIERIRRYISLFPDMTDPNHQISKPYILINRLKSKLINSRSQLNVPIQSTEISPDNSLFNKAEDQYKASKPKYKGRSAK